MQHKNAHQRRHHRLRKGQHTRLARRKSRQPACVEDIRQRRRKEPQAADAQDHPARYRRQIRAAGRKHDPHRAGRDEQRIERHRHRCVARQRHLAENAVERVADRRAQPRHDRYRRQTHTAAADQPRDKQTARKRQHHRADLLARDALLKKEPRHKDHKKRRRVQKHRRHRQRRVRLRHKIKHIEAADRDKARAHKHPDIPRADTKRLPIAHAEPARQHRRRSKAAKKRDRQRRHPQPRQIAREQANAAPTRRRKQHLRHSAALTSIFTHEIHSPHSVLLPLYPVWPQMKILVFAAARACYHRL